MNKFLKLLSLAFISGALMAPVAVRAQGRHNGAQRHQSSMQRPGGNSNVRPGNNKPHRPEGNRPGGNNFRPGQGGNNHHRPEGNRPGGNNFRPGGNHHAGPAFNGPRPRPHMAPPPPRPGRPVFRPWSRPVPPGSWRPGPRAPFFRTFLGINVGASVQLSMNTLYNNGYYVSGYDNGMLYLQDVNEMGFFWPNAVMMYNSRGGLCGSRFSFSSAYNDASRYSAVFNMLVANYGYPQVNASSSATWYGRDGSYITLNYGYGSAAYGAPGYYTTLTIGN